MLEPLYCECYIVWRMCDYLWCYGALWFVVVCTFVSMYNCASYIFYSCQENFVWFPSPCSSFFCLGFHYFYCCYCSSYDYDDHYAMVFVIIIIIIIPSFLLIPLFYLAHPPNLHSLLFLIPFILFILINH